MQFPAYKSRTFWIMVMRRRMTTMLTMVVMVKMNVTIATMAMTVLYVAVSAI